MLPLPYTICRIATDSAMIADANATAAINQAIAWFTANTLLTFALNGAGPNAIRFVGGTGASAYIGRVYTQAQQDVMIGTGFESVCRSYLFSTVCGFFAVLLRSANDNVYARLLSRAHAIR